MNAAEFGVGRVVTVPNVILPLADPDLRSVAGFSSELFPRVAAAGENENDGTVGKPFAAD